MSLVNATIQMSGQLELPLDYPGETRTGKRSESANTAGQGTGHSGSHGCLMLAIVARGNVEQAMRRVRQNQGSPGVDGMTVEEIPAYMRHGWDYTREQLLAGKYQPSPIRRQTIPKTGGGERILGIPTVVDRVIQQAILQVLQPIFDVKFSRFSYGFRPQRSAHDAVRQARQYVQDGRRWVVDVDLEKFFDRVNHDVLMGKLAARIGDKILLGLIRRYLGAGMLCDGVATARYEGTPQGGPLSPLLANVLLDEVDKELEKRGHTFVRYADDCNVYVRSRRAGQRVLRGLERCYAKLRLRINHAKSAVARVWERSFLGFGFWVAPGKIVKCRVAKETLNRFKERIRQITCRSGGRSLHQVAVELRGYLRGWRQYFSLADTQGVFQRLEQWMYHRLRAIVVKQWKSGTVMYQELRKRGISQHQAALAARFARCWWHVSGHATLNRALPVLEFDRLGVPRLVPQ